MNRKLFQIAGLFGIVCFLSGISFLLVKRELSWYVILNVSLGIVLMAVFAFFNLKGAAGNQDSTVRKGTRGTFVTPLLVLGIVALVNLFSNLFYFGRDLTVDRVSGISDHSQKAIQWIKEPFEILVFAREDGKDFEKYLLDSYNFHNKSITYRFIDPERTPQLAQRYGVTKTGQAVVRYKDGSLLVSGVSEELVTNAVIRLTQNVKNVVYFMQGHGEHTIDDLNANQGYGLLWRELQQDNYSVYKLKLEPPNYYIPGNCTILVVAGPRRGFTAFELKAVREYLENGGRALFLLDPNVTTNLEDLIAEWGIRVERDCMVDVVFPSLAERLAARMNGERAAPRPVFQVMARDFPDHDITRDLGGKWIMFSVARSLSVPERDTPVTDLQAVPLARTTSMGWSETHLDELFSRGKVSGDAASRRGPRDVAMLSVKGTAEANSMMIVIGDSDFVNNEFINQLYNRDFFMNCMAYLSRQTSLIAVRPRHMFASRIDYDPVVMTRIFTVSVLVFPQLILMAGLAIWWWRR